MQIKVLNAKQTLLDVADKLSPNATLADAIHELEFRLAVEEGLAELDRDEGIPIEEVKARIAAWQQVQKPAETAGELLDAYAKGAAATSNPVWTKQSA